MVMTLVEVVWHDAHSDVASWLDLEEIDLNPCVVVTVGILLPNHKPNHIVVIQSRNSFGSVDSVLCVPVGMVQGMRVLGTRNDVGSPID
jgi:hypothetical protein